MVSTEAHKSATLHVISDDFRRESSFFKDDPSNKATIFLENGTIQTRILEKWREVSSRMLSNITNMNT